VNQDLAVLLAAMAGHPRACVWCRVRLLHRRGACEPLQAIARTVRLLRRHDQLTGGIS
jgi:hypothetical protein